MSVCVHGCDLLHGMFWMQCVQKLVLEMEGEKLVLEGYLDFGEF